MQIKICGSNFPCFLKQSILPIYQLYIFHEASLYKEVKI